MEGPKNLEGVKRVIVVLSGKGGVGKSTVALQLASSFVSSGKKVSCTQTQIQFCQPRFLPLQRKIKIDFYFNLGWTT